MDFKAKYTKNAFQNKSHKGTLIYNTTKLYWHHNLIPFPPSAHSNINKIHSRRIQGISHTISLESF